MLRAAPRPFSPGQASPAQSAQADTSQPLDPKLPKPKVFGIANQKAKNQSFWSKNSKRQKTKTPKTLETQKTKIQKPELLVCSKKNKNQSFWSFPKTKKIVVFLEKLQKTQNQKFWRTYFCT